MKNKYLIFLFLHFTILDLSFCKNIIDCEVFSFGGEKIYLSDINEVENFLEQNKSDNINQIDILDKLIVNKILKKFCSKEFSKEEIKMQLNMKIKAINKLVEDRALEILSTYFNNDRKAFFNEIGLTVSDFISTNIKSQIEQIYISLAMQKFNSESSLVFSPKKINDFIEKNSDKNELLSEEKYEIYELVVDNIVPKEKNELIKNIKNEIDINTDEFENIISKYSDKDINFGEIDILTDIYPFNHALLKLKKNEISEIIDTDNAFYIIKWTNKSDNTKYNVIGLTLFKYDNNNNNDIIEHLKNIKSKIKNNELTWEEAVLKFSTNKKNKNYYGLITDKENKSLINKDYLSENEYNNIINMKDGDISDPIENTDNNGNKIFKLLYLKKKYKIKEKIKNYDFSKLIDLYNKKKTNEKITKIKNNIINNNTFTINNDIDVCKNWENLYLKNGKK